MKLSDCDLTEEEKGVEEVDHQSVGQPLAVGDCRINAGDDHVQQGAAHPLQLLYETVVVSVQLVIAALPLTCQL